MTLCPHCGKALEQSNVYTDGYLSLDFVRHEARVAGKERHLTKIEYRLLAHFVQHPGRVFSSDELTDVVWGQAYAAVTPGLPKWHIGNLRQKLPGVPIVTKYGHGYIYDAGNGT